VLTPARFAGLFQPHPAVDTVLVIPPRAALPRVVALLRAGRFDVGLVLPNSHRAALELWLARVPRRVGLSRPWRDWLLTAAVAPHAGAAPMIKPSPASVRRLVGARPPRAAPRPAPQAHHIHQYLHLAAALGAVPTPLAPRLEVSADERDAVRARFGLGASGPPWLAVNAGAEYGPAKRWPADRFIATAIAVQRRRPCRWLVLGGPADAALAAAVCAGIAAGVPAAAAPTNLAGATTLRELLAVLAICRAVLTNDTGPMHVAAAVGTPVVVPFGSTSPELTGPGLPGEGRHRLLRSEVPCAPCFLRTCPIDHRCMTGLGVDAAARAVEDLLGCA
jgi:heptosyltransferase-2